MPRRRSLGSWAPIPCATCTGQPQERITLPLCADLGPYQSGCKLVFANSALVWALCRWRPGHRPAELGLRRQSKDVPLLFLLLRLQLVDQLMPRVYSQRILTFQSWEGT